MRSSSWTSSTTMTTRTWPLPLDGDQQFLQAVGALVTLLDHLGDLKSGAELGEGAVDEPQLVEGVLADQLRVHPDLASSWSRSGHPAIASAGVRVGADLPANLTRV